MKPDEECIGKAVRIEYSENDGKLFVVFEITNERYKQKLKAEWMNDLEFKLIDKQLVEND